MYKKCEQYMQIFSQPEVVGPLWKPKRKREGDIKMELKEDSVI